MRRLAFVSALTLSLLAPAARADDSPADRRERALELRERTQEQRERALDQRELQDDQRDLARIESLAARLETMRSVRPPNWAVAALDADVQRELNSERLEGRSELWRDTQEVRRSQAELNDDRRDELAGARMGDGRSVAGARRAQSDDRRDLADDVRDRQVESAHGQRVQTLRSEWATLRGRYGRPGLERRRVLLSEFVTLARQELAGDRQERREDRGERWEDRQGRHEERREDRRQ